MRGYTPHKFSSRKFGWKQIFDSKPEFLCFRKSNLKGATYEPFISLDTPRVLCELSFYSRDTSAQKTLHLIEIVS